MFYVWPQYAKIKCHRNVNFKMIKQKNNQNQTRKYEGKLAKGQGMKGREGKGSREKVGSEKVRKNGSEEVRRQ